MAELSPSLMFLSMYQSPEPEPQGAQGYKLPLEIAVSCAAARRKGLMCRWSGRPLPRRVWDRGGHDVSEGRLSETCARHSWSSPQPALEIPALKKPVLPTLGFENRGSPRVSPLLRATGEFIPSRTQWISSPHNCYYARSPYNISFSLTKLAHEPKLD